MEHLSQFADPAIFWIPIIYYAIKLLEWLRPKMLFVLAIPVALLMLNKSFFELVMKLMKKLGGKN